jgi:ribosomal protein S25
LKGSKGKTFTELTDDVVKNVRKKMPSFKGAIPWYTISVLRDLETRGVVESFTGKGKKLNRLKK